MMTYHHGVAVDLPYPDAVTATKVALVEQGFGVLTEIDVQAMMKTTQGKDMESYVILGACNPVLAQQAIDADRSAGVLLPCNVVVRGDGDGSVVQVLDPQLMAAVTDLPAMATLADEATTRLDAVLDQLRVRSTAIGTRPALPEQPAPAVGPDEAVANNYHPSPLA